MGVNVDGYQFVDIPHRRILLFYGRLFLRGTLYGFRPRALVFTGAHAPRFAHVARARDDMDKCLAHTAAGFNPHDDAR